MEPEQAQFSGWAKVEVMGHQSHIGFVRTEAYGGAVLFRIDTPELPEREFELTEPSYVDVTGDGGTRWMKEGTKVKRRAQPGVSVLVGAGSIYRIVPCSEAAAMKAIEGSARTPLCLVGLPPSQAIEAPGQELDELDSQEDPDDPDNREDEDEPF